ncbi:hypothetical protein WN944_007787 [Citrus x changshan-huyou]|uniref:Uncharacterized protein n=1 Tax=Citrus x changshan-huyou TaxID=2935761 RepID=A0AAP0MRG1_9ROSI
MSSYDDNDVLRTEPWEAFASFRTVLRKCPRFLANLIRTNALVGLQRVLAIIANSPGIARYVIKSNCITGFHFLVARYPCIQWPIGQGKRNQPSMYKTDNKGLSKTIYVLTTSSVT